MSKNSNKMPIKGLSETEDALMQMILALAAQLSATRERVDTLETLLERGGNLSADAVEGFEPDEQDVQRRNAIREAIVAKVMKPIVNGLKSDLQELENHDG